MIHFTYYFAVERRKNSKRVQVWEERDGRPSPRLSKGAIRGTVSLASIKGRPEPVQLTIGPDPSETPEEAARAVTAEVLRAVPIGAIVKKALEYRAAGLREDMETHKESLVNKDIRASFERRLRKAEREAEQIRPGPRGHGPAYYAEVAEVYLAALQTSRTPTKAVADHFGVQPSTANKLVERSRHHYGFIPPASQGKATGLSQTTKRTNKGRTT